MHERGLVIPLDNPPCKIRKGLPFLHKLAQVRLREHSQRVPRNARWARHLGAPDKVRHGTEFALRDQLQGLARLERKAVPGDVDLDGIGRAGADVETRLGVRGGREFLEWLRGIRRRRESGGFVDEHGRREARQTAVVKMRGAPIVVLRIVVLRIVGFGLVVILLVLGREVVQQPGLAGQAGLDNVLQVSRRVSVDVGLGVAVAGARDERRSVDYQVAQVRQALAERGHAVTWRPDVGRRVLGEVREVVCGGILELWVLVECAVDVVGALQGVEVPGAQRLFAAGPADEVFRFGALERFCGRLDIGSE